jgi:hypothetical protein
VQLPGVLNRRCFEPDVHCDAQFAAQWRIPPTFCRAARLSVLEQLSPHVHHPPEIKREDDWFKMKTPTLPPFDHQPKKYAGPSADEVLAQRKQFMNPGIFLYYKKPIMFVEGKMQYIWDDAGKRYLDGLGGIVTISVGHCHPHVVAAATKQNETLQHSTTIYLQPERRRVCRKTGFKDAGRPEGLLLRQLRFGSE